MDIGYEILSSRMAAEQNEECLRSAIERSIDAARESKNNIQKQLLLHESQKAANFMLKYIEAKREQAIN